MPSPKETQIYLKSLVAFLRQSCPLLLPVRVYFRDQLGDELGHAVLHAKEGSPHHFTVSVLKGDLHRMRDTLIHEWAHCRAWTPGESGESFDDHPDDWGIAFARVYRCLLASGL